MTSTSWATWTGHRSTKTHIESVRPRVPLTASEDAPRSSNMVLFRYHEDPRYVLDVSSQLTCRFRTRGVRAGVGFSSDVSAMSVRGATASLAWPGPPGCRDGWRVGPSERAGRARGGCRVRHRRPRKLSLAYFALGPDARASADRYLMDYYGWLGDVAHRSRPVPRSAPRWSTPTPARSRPPTAASSSSPQHVPPRPGEPARRGGGTARQLVDESPVMATKTGMLAIMPIHIAANISRNAARRAISAVCV